MNNDNKDRITYTKEMLIKRIADDSKRDLKTIRTIYNALEQNVFEILSSANINTDVSVRLFEGISVNSTFIPEKTKLNNLTGEEIITLSKIKPKANITRSYREKLTNHNK